MDTRRGTPHLRLVVALAVLVCGHATALRAHPGTAAHLHERLELRISINDQLVQFEIQASGLLIRNRIDGALPSDAWQSENDRFDFTSADAAAEQRRILEAYFQLANPVTIDEMLVEPELVTLELRPPPTAPEPEPAPAPSDATPTPTTAAAPAEITPDILLVLTYSTKGPPKQVDVVWELYPTDYTMAMRGLEAAMEVVAELDAYDRSTVVRLTPQEPEYIWHAPGRPGDGPAAPRVIAAEPQLISVPTLLLIAIALGTATIAFLRLRQVRPAIRRSAWVVVILAVAVAALNHHTLALHVPAPWAEPVVLPSEARAVEIFTTLHRNVYRAFDRKTESDIYDVLARSVDGELLDRVYNEVYQSLILRDQGGAVCRVQAVDILESHAISIGLMPETEQAAFRVRSRWRVEGLVYHWNHVHLRTNEYEAIHTVAQRGDEWKITGVETLAQRRIVSEGDDPPDVTPLEPAEPGP